MTKALIIAEKPSVARDIANALSSVVGNFTTHEDYFENDNYVISSAIGHLVTIKAPEEYEVKRGKWNLANLPVIPPTFALEAVDKTKSRLNVVVRLMKRKDVTVLINACDAGREGELIFRLIEQYAGGEKGTTGKTIKRMWLQSMTPQAIREGFQNMRSDAAMKGLADAARCRSEADWIVGINGTRAMTAFNSRDGGFFLTTVGRVQTPTLSLMVEREIKIRNHVPKDYWEVHAAFQASGGQYQGKWFDPKWKKPAVADSAESDLKADRIWVKPDAEKIARETAGKPVVVTEESKPTSSMSPQLFDLTSLQREANSKLGLSAKTTLSLAQALYEKHKVLTYPRTDSRFLPDDYVPVAIETLKSLQDGVQSHLAPFARQAITEQYVKPTKRVFDGKKISDHFAIIPTTAKARGLNELEQKIYDMVARRFMAVFFPAAEFTTTVRISKVGEHSFRTDGKVLIRPGWLAIYGREAEAEDSDPNKQQSMIALKPGEPVQAVGASPKDLQTKSQPRYNEATMLGAMEGAAKQMEGELKEAMGGKGLGTPATRAAILEGLLHEQYINREGKELVPSAKAFQLMTLLKGLDVKEMTRADLTGEWEHKLSMIEKNELSREQFMTEIAGMTRHMVECARSYDRDTIPGDYAVCVNPCPNCKGVVSEHYRHYSCSCGFAIAKAPASRIFELHEIEELLINHRIGPLIGFKSKTGFPFKSEIRLVKDVEKNNWKMEFDFGEKADDGGKSTADFTGKTPLGTCPVCKGNVFEDGKKYVCEHAVETESNPKPKCEFKAFKTILQQEVSEEQIKKMLTTGKTDLLDKFVSSRTGRTFKAFLVWDGSRVNFEFPPREGGAPGGGGKSFGGKPFHKGGKHKHSGPKLGSKGSGNTSGPQQRDSGPQGRKFSAGDMDKGSAW